MPESQDTTRPLPPAIVSLPPQGGTGSEGEGTSDAQSLDSNTEKESKEKVLKLIQDYELKPVVSVKKH